MQLLMTDRREFFFIFYNNNKLKKYIAKHTGRKEAENLMFDLKIGRVCISFCRYISFVKVVRREEIKKKRKKRIL